MPNANGSLLDSSDDVEDGGVSDVNEEHEGKYEEESDASSREEGQEWEVDSFDDGFDYRPRRNLDPNDEIGQKMHRYRSSMDSMLMEMSYPGSILYRTLFPSNSMKPFEC
ncbi:hypothetical protein Rs2_50997 [Raphanus sativus]|nr:hypothetical protein Rs2_50997 [Raphanus sativus]